MIYGYKGELATGTSDKILKAGQMGLLINRDNIPLATQDEPARCLELAAIPLQEPVVQSNPFVTNSTEETEQAFRDYRKRCIDAMNQFI